MEAKENNDGKEKKDKVRKNKNKKVMALPLAWLNLFECNCVAGRVCLVSRKFSDNDAIVKGVLIRCMKVAAAW